MPTYRFPGVVIKSRYNWSLPSILVAGALMCALFVVVRWVGAGRRESSPLQNRSLQMWQLLPTKALDSSPVMTGKINNDGEEFGVGHANIYGGNVRYESEAESEERYKSGRGYYTEREEWDNQPQERNQNQHQQLRRRHQQGHYNMPQQQQRHSSAKRRRLTKKQRRLLIESQGGRCGMCSKAMEDYEIAIDHRVPLCAQRLGIRGDLNADWNLWAICVLCHARKCRLESRQGLYRRNI